VFKRDNDATNAKQSQIANFENTINKRLLLMTSETEEALEKFQSSLKAQLEAMRPNFNDSMATALIHSCVTAILVGGEGEIESGAERAPPGQLLKGLIDGIFAEFDKKKIQKWTLREYYCALVKDERLDATLWKGCADAAINDAVGKSRDLAKKLESLVMAAAEVGSIKAIKAITSSSEETQFIINLAADNNYAIRMASRNGHVEVVKLLLDKKEENFKLYGRIDPAAKNNYAIRWASWFGCIEVVKLLFEKKEENPSLYGEIDPVADNNFAIRMGIKKWAH
jgi:hypothetical protein